MNMYKKWHTILGKDQNFEIPYLELCRSTDLGQLLLCSYCKIRVKMLHCLTSTAKHKRDTMQSDKSHENLARERSRASFPIRLMTNYLDGGEEATAKREQAMGFLEDPKYAKALATTSIKAKREQTRERIDTLFKLFFEHSLEDVALRRAMVQAFGAFDMSWYVRNGVSHGLFASAITSQGTREQQNHWLFRIMMQEIFGSFSMTELGHGTTNISCDMTCL